MNVPSSRNDYSPIPDVDPEQQDQTNVPFDSSLLNEEQAQKELAEKYPEANECELKFLGALDTAIAKYSEPKIGLPRLAANGQELGSSTSDSMPEFLKSLTIPTGAFVTCACAGIEVLATNNPIYEALYPYASCVLLFVSSIYYLRQRFVQRCEAIVDRIESRISAVVTTLETLSTSAIRQLNEAEACMDSALKPIQEKLDKVTEFEEMLRVIDPDIDIPDISDIEEAFDGCADKIESVFKSVLQGSQEVASNVVPEMFQSVEMLAKRLLYPFLAVVLVIQLFGVFTTESVKGTLVDESIEEEPFAIQAENLIITPFLTFITTIIEMVVAFALSQLASLIKRVNDYIKGIEDEINQVLKERAGATFDLVFNKGLGEVREKTLKLIRDVEKIEAPLKKVLEMKRLQVLKDKALAEAEKRAKEIAGKMEEAKEEAEKMVREAEEKAKEALEIAKEDAEKKAQETRSLLGKFGVKNKKKRFGF
jgi:hypothetical protein